MAFYNDREKLDIIINGLVVPLETATMLGTAREGDYNTHEREIIKHIRKAQNLALKYKRLYPNTGNDPLSISV